jgi:DNA-binding NarL/FixJ family response regulator
MVQVVVADQRAWVRSAVQLWLEYELHWPVVSEVGHADEVLAVVDPLRPTLLLLDQALPGVQSGALRPWLDALRSHCAVLTLIVFYGDEPAVQVAVAHPRETWVSKGTSLLDLRSVLQRAAQVCLQGVQ